MLDAHPRIAVLGTTASGKTVLSRALARALGSQHIELDRLYWGAGWQPRADFLERVTAAIAADRWIVDGTYESVRESVWRRATAVVWLDYPAAVVWTRALRRTLGRVIRRVDHAVGDNRESLRRALLHPQGTLWWAIRTHAARRTHYATLLAEPRFRHLHVLRLRSPRQARTVIGNLRAGIWLGTSLALPDALRAALALM